MKRFLNFSVIFMGILCSGSAIISITKNNWPCAIWSITCLIWVIGYRVSELISKDTEETLRNDISELIKTNDDFVDKYSKYRDKYWDKLNENYVLAQENYKLTQKLLELTNNEEILRSSKDDTHS